MTQNKNSISWKAPEFRHYPKTSTWYLTLIILSVAAIAFFIIFEKDIFAAVCLAILAILIIIFSRPACQTSASLKDNRRLLIAVFTFR